MARSVVRINPELSPAGSEWWYPSPSDPRPPLLAAGVVGQRVFLRAIDAHVRDAVWPVAQNERARKWTCLQRVP
jgi:hypothetical protein